MDRKRISFMAVSLILVFIHSVIAARGFSGGGGSIYFGTGSPNSIDAVSELADDLDIDDRSGNYILGIQGFYQGERYRLGGMLQAHAWAGFNLTKNNTNHDVDYVNPGKNNTDDEVAGIAGLVGGLNGSYTIRHDRILLNVGAVLGAGRCFLGYSLEGEGENREVSVSTFFIEPQVSLGVATCRWFAVEFQLSSPIFILTEDLKLSEAGRIYTVKSGDMMGVNFSIKLTFGKIANP